MIRYDVIWHAVLCRATHVMLCYVINYMFTTCRVMRSYVVCSYVMFCCVVLYVVL